MDIPDKWLLVLIKILLLITLSIAIVIISFTSLKFFITAVIPIFMPFIIALVIALVIDPVVDLVEKKFKLNRTIASFITLIAVMAIIGYGLVFVITLAIVELVEFTASLPMYYNLVYDTLEQVFTQAKYLQYLYFIDVPENIQEQMLLNLENILMDVRDFSREIIDYIILFMSSLPGFMTLIIIASIATFFISRDRKKIARGVVNVLPVAIRDKTVDVFKDLSNATIGFLRAQLILITITGIQTVVGLYIIGVDYAITVGILVGIVDILPILGPGLIFIPWVIIVLLLGNPGFALSLLLLYGVVIVVRILLEPKIVADNIGLHPLTTLIGIYVGLKTLGLIGVIAGPLIIIIIKAILRKDKKN
ncbi:sporulation integral membrane protein YtvI [Desulfitispora alkaliphila]|uniref:sporulation integral membrane protein YtvI n=1 Tax=Desulfitispora alkaliphila TaxID=622674 RepID=UPI003D1DDC1A